MEIKIGCGNGTLLLIQIILLLLKLFKVVNWSWWIIFIPTLFVGGMVLLSLVLIVIYIIYK